MDKNLVRNTNKKTLKICICIITSLVFAALIALIIMLFSIRFDNRVYNNVYLNEHNVSKMKPEELALYVSSLGEKLENFSVDIYEEKEKVYTITSSMIDLKLDINDTVKNVLAFGRSKNLIQNVKEVLSNKGKHINLSASYSKEKLDKVVKNIDLTLNSRVIYDTYSLNSEGTTLVLTKGRDGYVADSKELEEKLISQVMSFNSNDIYLKLSSVKSSILDKDDIIKKIKKEVRDAYIDDTTVPVTFVKESYGVDVDIKKLQDGLDGLKNLNEGESIHIDLNVIKPSVYLSDIKYDMYNDKISSYTTYFAGNQINRSKNIEISSNLINEKIIMPGEVFSFNNTVGDVTPDKGYVNAATFQGGKIVDGLGGGICQVSSTLYNTVLLANLEIIERYSHSLPVSYVLPGRDATIYVGALDFKFKNNRTYPIKIITNYSRAGTLTISIYGTKEDVEYDIEIESNVLKELDYGTEYIYDSSVPKGTEIVVNSGVNGIVSEAYIIKKLYGKEVERSLLSKDTYFPSNKVVKRSNNN